MESRGTGMWEKVAVGPIKSQCSSPKPAACLSGSLILIKHTALFAGYFEEDTLPLKNKSVCSTVYSLLTLGFSLLSNKLVKPFSTGRVGLTVVPD